MDKTSASTSGTLRSSVQLVEGFSLILRGVQYMHALKTLQKYKGNYPKAARALGVRLTTFCRYVDRLDLACGGK